MKTVSYKMKEKAKSEGEDAVEAIFDLVSIATPIANPNVAIAGAPSLDLALLSKDVKLIKDLQNKHIEQLEFMEKVQLNIQGKLNIMFPTTFASYQTAFTTPVLDVATLVVLVALADPPVV